MSELCDFCFIETEPERILYRTELITSFLSLPFLTKGHALVIPNKHFVRPEQLSDEMIVAIQREADRLSGVMLGSIAMGVDRWQKTRPFVEEEPDKPKRDHLHEHVLPSSEHEMLYDTAIIWGGDMAPWMRPGETPEEQADFAEMVALLRHPDQNAA
jgi:hypothetical protein